MASELKPCPFCGRLPQIRSKVGYWIINCWNGECPVLPEKTAVLKKWAVQGWNQRRNYAQ